MENIIQHNGNGRLFKTTKDFFNQETIKDQIKSMLKSDLVKRIDNKTK